MNKLSPTDTEHYDESFAETQELKIPDAYNKVKNCDLFEKLTEVAREVSYEIVKNALYRRAQENHRLFNVQKYINHGIKQIFDKNYRKQMGNPDRSGIYLFPTETEIKKATYMVGNILIGSLINILDTALTEKNERLLTFELFAPEDEPELIKLFDERLCAHLASSPLTLEETKLILKHLAEKLFSDPDITQVQFPLGIVLKILEGAKTGLPSKLMVVRKLD